MRMRSNHRDLNHPSRQFQSPCHVSKRITSYTLRGHLGRMSVLDAARQVDDVSKGPLPAISNPEDPDLDGELTLYKQRKEMLECFASVAGPVTDKTFAIRSPELLRLAAVLASSVCRDDTGEMYGRDFWGVNPTQIATAACNLMGVNLGQQHVDNDDAQ